MRAAGLAIAVSLFAGCTSGEFDLDEALRVPQEHGRSCDGATFATFHETWKDNVTALHVRINDETRQVRNGTSEWDDLVRESLRAMYEVRANLKESSRPEAELGAAEHVRADLRAPQGIWLPRAYECGRSYSSETMLVTLGNPVTVRPCQGGMCSATGSDMDPSPLRDAAEAAWASGDAQD